jgi:prepilin signal peptidase PulO-like enzyme (type II secretory pathway)
MKEYTIIASHVYVKTVRIVIYVLVPVVVLAQFFVHSTIIKVMILTLFFMLSLSFYLWIVIKAVEKSCMFKYVTPDKLTEGDWIAKDVRYNGKYITGPKDLGIEKKQILVLQKLYRAGKIKNILIKEGIPFVPSFLLGWIMTLSLGNVLGLILG